MNLFRLSTSGDVQKQHLIKISASALSSLVITALDVTLQSITAAFHALTTVKTG